MPCGLNLCLRGAEVAPQLACRLMTLHPRHLRMLGWEHTASPSLLVDFMPHVPWSVTNHLHKWPDGWSTARCKRDKQKDGPDSARPAEMLRDPQATLEGIKSSLCNCLQWCEELWWRGLRMMASSANLHATETSDFISPNCGK